MSIVSMALVQISRGATGRGRRWPRLFAFRLQRPMTPTAHQSRSKFTWPSRSKRHTRPSIVRSAPPVGCATNGKRRAVQPSTALKVLLPLSPGVNRERKGDGHARLHPFRDASGCRRKIRVCRSARIERTSGLHRCRLARSRSAAVARLCTRRLAFQRSDVASAAHSCNPCDIKIWL